MSVWSRQRRRRLTMPASSPIGSGTASPTWLMMAKAIRPLDSETEPVLLGVTDGFEVLVPPSQRLVENLYFFTALFVGRLGGATGTFGLHSRRTLAPQQAEVL